MYAIRIKKYNKIRPFSQEKGFCEKKEALRASPRSYNERKIPVLFIITSNASDSYYPSLGYDETLQKYGSTLDAFIGKTKFFISGNTLQVKNYDRFDWTLFDVNEKIRRHEEDFPKEEEKAFILGKDIVSNPC